MKIQLIFVALFSITLHAVVISKPITIINSTTLPIHVEIFAQSYNEPIKVIISAGDKQQYDMQNIIFERIVWSTYGKKESDDAFLLKKYAINVQEKMPTIVHGGTIVLSLGGEYMYDDKSGRRNAVKFGKGDIIKGNGIEKGQSNEE